MIILGGTGTLGQAVTEKLLAQGQRVTIFSRDELKQKQMKDKFQSNLLRFIIGDVKDYDSVEDAIRGHKTVFLFAAIKHVSAAEDNPLEAIKTNIHGAMNVVRACNTLGVKHLTFSSTDKAVSPINTYGYTKSIAEQIILKEAKMCATVCRYGNVLGSRGSVLGIFAEAFKNKKQITITDKAMTRFWIKIEDAAAFVLERTGHHGLHIPLLKASKVTDVAEAVGLVLGMGKPDYKDIGIGKGEKLHEQLSNNYFSHSTEQYTVAELVGMIRGML